MHSNASQISRRRSVLQTAENIKLNRILIFRCEADERHAYALSSFFSYNPSKHTQRGTDFDDLELQGYFLAYLYVWRGLQQHAGFADIHAAQRDLLIIPGTDDLRKKG